MLFVLMLIVLAIASIVGTKMLYNTLTYGTKSIHGLSWPAQQIVKEFNKLPKEVRPYGDIVTIVKALDISAGGAGVVDSHHKSAYYEDTSYSWNCCYHRNVGCRTEDYHNIHNSIGDLAASVKRQEQELKCASVSGSLDEAKEIVERLRQERVFVDEVTKELR